MREAVIVSTARTPIGKAYRGAFNDTQAQTLGGHAIANALDARPRRRRRGRRRGDGRGDAAGLDRLQLRAPVGLTRRPSDQRRRHVGRPAMRLRPDGDFDRRQGDRQRRHEHRRRRRARIDLAGAKRQDEPLPQRRTRGSSSIATTSTCRCSRRPRSSRSATRSRASGRTNIALQSHARTAAAQAAGRFEAEIVPLLYGDESHRQGDRRRLRQGGHAEA